MLEAVFTQVTEGKGAEQQQITLSNSPARVQVVHSNLNLNVEVSQTQGGRTSTREMDLFNSKVGTLKLFIKKCSSCFLRHTDHFTDAVYIF